MAGFISFTSFTSSLCYIFVIADHLTKNTFGKSNSKKPTNKIWKKINRTKTFEKIHHAMAERKLL